MRPFAKLFWTLVNCFLLHFSHYVQCAVFLGGFLAAISILSPAHSPLQQRHISNGRNSAEPAGVPVRARGADQGDEARLEL